MATLSSLLLTALLWVPVGTLTCYGDSGQPVDWFVVYKLPAHTGSGDATQNGLRYKYFDEHSEDWSDGVGFINSTTGAVGRSLLPLYRNNNSQLAFVLYNDQPPKSSESKDSSSRGHTKGEATLGAGGGFWFPYASSSADS